MDENDESRATCQVCNCSISEGSKPGFTTTYMLKHLNAKHNTELQAEKKSSLRREGSMKKVHH